MRSDTRTLVIAAVLAVPLFQPAWAQEPANPQMPASQPAAAPGTQAVSTQDPLITPDPALPLLQPWYDVKAQAKNKLDMEINPSYTFLYQNATNVIGDQNDLLNGRLDLNINWYLLRDGKNTGSIGFLLRSGVNIGSNQDFSLAPQIGDNMVSNAIQGGGEEQPITVNLIYWRQSFFDDKLAFYIGKIHPNQHIDLDPMNNDETRQFLAAPFDGNLANPQEGNYAPGAAVEYTIVENVYFHALVMDALGAPGTGFNTTFDGKYYEAAQLGWEPDVKDLGKGNYRVFGWHTQAKDGSEGSGVGVGFSQEIGDGWAPFARWGYADADVCSFRQMVSGGLANTRPFGRRGDMFGIALAWGDPTSSDATVRQQTMLETFYRLKLTESLELSPDLQLFMPPSSKENQDFVAVFGLRLKALF